MGIERPTYEGKPDFTNVESAPLSRLAQESNSIVALSLHSNALLLPPFVNWTLSLIYSHSSLTCITFSHPTFPEEVRTTLLPLIADMVSNRLTKLSILFEMYETHGRKSYTIYTPSTSFNTPFSRSAVLFKVSIMKLTPPYLPRLQILQAPTELVSLILDVQSPSYLSGNKEASTGFQWIQSLKLNDSD